MHKKNGSVEQVKEADRQWFADRPGQLWRIRPIVEGEFAPEYPHPTHEELAYVFFRPDNRRCYRCVISPQERDRIQSGELILFPMVVDDAWKWQAVMRNTWRPGQR